MISQTVVLFQANCNGPELEDVQPARSERGRELRGGRKNVGREQAGKTV